MVKALVIAGMLLQGAGLPALHAQQKNTTSQGTDFDIPQLSPRPRLVKTVADPRMSLNGDWGFSKGEKGKVSTIKVPGEWEMQGHVLTAGETAIYSRSFNLPADWKGKRIKLRFDGVSSWCRVSVNGKTIMSHEGGFVPFEGDITHALKPGTNELQVAVQAHTMSDRLGCVSQYAVHTVGGILRKVELFALPATHIAQQDIATQFDQGYSKANLLVDFALVGGEDKTGMQNLKFTLRDATGKTVFTKMVAARIGSGGAEKLVLPVGKVKSWNPELPYLYTLETALIDQGDITEVLVEKVGFRDVKIRGGILLVNGKPIKLHGVNRHDSHPLTGRSLSPELCRKDAELFKKGNCNYIRTSHYPPSEEFLQAADEIGLFVESESAITWIQHGASPIWKLWNYTDEKFLPYFVRANVEKVNAQRNHPSVIIWSLANESRWSPLWAKVNKIVKELDPIRPTTFHDQCWGGYNNAHSTADIAVYHYPGTNGPAATDTMKRPTLFGEYAHLSCYNRRELVTDPGIRAAYGAPLVQMYDSIYRHANTLGGAIWSGVDDTFHMPDGRIVGYGPWGPIDGWRREKPEYYGMKKAYAPVVITNLQTAKRTGNILLLDIENRFDFTTLTGANVRCLVGGEAVPITLHIEPHAKGAMRIPLKANSVNTEVLVSFTDPSGLVVNEESIHLDQSELADVREEKEWPIGVTEDAQALHVTQGGLLFEINKLNGLVTANERNGKIILSQGPVWGIVPMNEEDGGKPNVAGETYQNNIYPLKNYPLYTIFVTDIKAVKTDSAIVVHQDVSYTDAKGNVNWYFLRNGKVRVEYTINYAGTDTVPRQYGMMMQLPIGFDELSWKRKGSFTTYPVNDIARNEGTAKLNARTVGSVEEWGKVPKGDWKDDANELGSTDFRSTKRYIYTAVLKDKEGSGIKLESNGKQSLRCWLQDNRIQLLVADYSNNGSEPFYGSPHSNGRIKLKKDPIKGQLTFSLINR